MRSHAVDSPLPTLAPSILVLGYGNELRGDDAVGPRVANAVADWQLAGVETLAVHQLTPELAADIASARAAIFVDAVLASAQAGVEVRPILPAEAAAALTHAADPRSLLALSQAAFGRCPPAWWVTIPVGNLEFGEGLSPLAERGLAVALGEIRRLCEAIEAGCATC